MSPALAQKVLERATFSERIGRKSVDLSNYWSMAATDSERIFLTRLAIAQNQRLSDRFLVIRSSSNTTWKVNCDELAFQ